MTTLTQKTRDIFARLRELAEARDSLSIDWAGFNGLMGGVGESEDFEAAEARFIAALMGACTAEKPMAEEQARRVSDLLGVLADAQAEADCIESDQLAALLSELAGDDDAAGLWLALRLVPYDASAYVESLRTLADATDPSEPGEPARLKVAQARALQSAALPGQAIDDALAAAFVEAVTYLNVLSSETPRRQGVRKAFTEARRLIEVLGEGDPRAMDAVLKAIELQDPGCCKRMLAESGIHLPEPGCCTEDGTPLYSLDAVAEALDADPDELLLKARELEAFGLGVLHIAESTHALQ